MQRKTRREYQKQIKQTKINLNWAITALILGIIGQFVLMFLTGLISKISYSLVFIILAISDVLLAFSFDEFRKKRNDESQRKI